MSAMRDDQRVSWTIRRAGPGDAAALGALAPRLFRQAYEPTHPEPTLGAYLRERFAPERVEALLADLSVRVLLVEAASGELLGYAQLQAGAPGAPGTVVERPLPGSRPLEIVRFYVDEAWHGRGIAAALMAACDAEARARGADVLWLQAWQQAGRALAFYAKAGFQVVGTAVFTFGPREDADYLLARAVPEADVRAEVRVTLPFHDRYAKEFLAGWGTMDFNGHMANTAYLDLAADVRMAFFAEHGFPPSEFRRLALGPVVRKDELEYFREVGLHDRVTVTYAALAMSADGARFVLENEIWSAAGQRAAAVRSTGGWLDLRARKLVAPPAALLEVFLQVPRAPGFVELPATSGEPAARGGA